MKLDRTDLRILKLCQTAAQTYSQLNEEVLSVDQVTLLDKLVRLRSEGYLQPLQKGGGALYHRLTDLGLAAIVGADNAEDPREPGLAEGGSE